MTLLGWKTTFVELANEMWELGIVLTRKQWELGHASARYATLNPHVSLSTEDSITYFKVCPMCYQTNPIYSLSFETKLHLNGIETVLLINLIKDFFKKNSSPIYNHQGLSYFDINDLIMVYFTLIYFTTYLINLLT